MMHRDLVEQAQRGDHDKFEALASIAFDGLYALAHRILRDFDRTDDAVQECLIRAWRELPQFRDPGRIEAWLRRLLVNACHDEVAAGPSPLAGDPCPATGAPGHARRGDGSR